MRGCWERAPYLLDERDKEEGRVRAKLFISTLDCGSGTHEPAGKETKTALCMRMSSEVHELDPAPEPPNSLQNRKYVSKLAKEIASTKSMEVASTNDENSSTEDGVSEDGRTHC